MIQTNIGIGILTAMISPAILISACAGLIISTSQRLARIVERVREISGSSSSTVSSSERIFLLYQLQIHTARAKLLQSALMGLYVAVVMFVATSFEIGIVSIGQGKIIWIPMTTALIGASILLITTLILLKEGKLAIRSTFSEMHFAKSLLQSRAA